MNNLKEVFSNKVDAYKNFRPSYPEDAILYLKKLGVSNNSTIADIGSGTGIFSEQIITEVKKLYGIEPNKEMRKAAGIKLEKFTNHVSVDSCAEETKLESNSVDYITVAQAFHWFDTKKALAEFKRILRSSGKLILLWNRRETTSAFLRNYETILKNHLPSYNEVKHQILTDEKIKDCFSEYYKKSEFSNTHELDFDGLKGRLLSCSYSPHIDASNYELLMNKIEELFEMYNHNGVIDFQYSTTIYSGLIQS